MEITSTSNISSNEFTNQNYKDQDVSLLNNLVINKEFGQPEDKVEIHILSPNGDLLNSIYDFRNYSTRNLIEDTSLYNTIELNPKQDLESFGYFRGQYDIAYYFYRQLFQSSESNKFFISEISSDRTEIKISSNNISYNDLGQSYLNYITTRNSRAFYSDFLINAGDNKTYIGVNVALDNVNTSLPSLYIKLYEPLPSNFKLKDTFWVVENLSETQSFRVNTEFIAEAISDSTPLRGPNISIELNEKNNLSTPYLNLNTLLDPSTSSSYQQLQSWIEEKSIEIPVDYNDFSNFVHFSSAQERLENFKFKLIQIQNLQSDINSLDGLNVLTSPGYIVVSKNKIQSQIDSIIAKFDGYEYFLYFESGSNSWPKINNEKPYINDVPTSVISKTWYGAVEESSIYYGGKLLEANNYDIGNRDYIWNNLPEYIKEDSQNANLELFIAMMGQHYDYIWTYAKDITNLQVSDNRLDHGISKDLVADTLRNFGIKLYTNSRGQEDLYISLLGIDANYGTLPSTGSYVIDNYVTSSQYTIPSNDILKETYKRLYHNLPYLLKTKGTRRGLRALINCFGIPETILKVKEYGGNKKDQNIIEQFNEKFNYSLNLNNTASLAIPFEPSYKQYLTTGEIIYPDTIEYRFKLDGVYPTQSLLENSTNTLNVIATSTSDLHCDVSFNISGSLGRISSPSISLPLNNNDWWTLNLTRETGSVDPFNLDPNTYILTIGNKDTNGVQYLTSSSLTPPPTPSNSYKAAFNESSILYPGGNNINNSFSGSIQEFRYWINSIPTSNFTDHILNPQSISNGDVINPYDKLIFRLPLGSELDNTTTPTLTSVHPSPTSSFWNGVNNFSTSSLINSSSATYVINHELFLVNTPNIGTITEIDEKVRITNPNLIPGDVLTPYISIQKPEEYPYTPDLSIVEVAISPQDSINEDIISQLGSFNIDEYIGDPRLNSSNTYPALNELRDFYFKKYSNSQNIFDIIKLLSYFDNSLFKMIKDFVPARTNLSTGLTIKSHILERNKITRHEPALTFVNHSGSIETAFITGSNGLNLNLNTDHITTTQYLSGSISKLNNDKRELINGELGGTIIKAHTPTLENIVYELNHIATTSSQDIHNNFHRLPLNPTLNNVSKARTSPKHLDIDYAYNPITPVNFNFLTASLQSNLTNPNFPFLNAAVQDSNYTLKRHTQPRYEGSKLIGTNYNTYAVGDISYGKDPVINTNPVKFAYFKEITSQSLTLPGRSNVNIKYLIDKNSNIVELTEANKNLFDVQDIFNRTKANIALENVNQPSKQKPLNGLKEIYAGGFKYEPILQNNSTPLTNWNQLQFVYENEIPLLNPSQTPITQSAPGILDPGIPVFANPPEYTFPNYGMNSLNVDLQSEVRFPNVKRIGLYQGEIRQRVTGNIQLNIKVSPTSPLSTLYSKRTDTSQTGLITWSDIDLGFYNYNDGKISPINGVQWNNNIRSVNLPSGVTGQFYKDGDRAGGVMSSIIGNGQRQNILNYTSDGPSSFDLKSNGTTISFYQPPVTNQFNPNNPVTFNKTSGNYIIEENDGFILTLTFPIEGYIILPANQNNISVELTNLLGQVSLISTNVNINKTNSSGQIQFLNPPDIIYNILPLGPPFIYTEPPQYIYQTGSFDNGFNSGSSNNYYFERGNSVSSGSKFTYLTASYDLSNIYYNNNLTKNNIIQVLPSGSLETPLGNYQNITEYFIPKRGDIIRFYNHDSNKFPFTSDFEREIINIFPPQGTPIGSGSNGSGSYDNRLVFEVGGTDIPNQSCINSPSGSNVIGKIQNFLFLSKIEDETNIIIVGDKMDGQTSPGILLTENISSDLKDEAGNIIKDLKSKNLI